uniref:ZP domain-containing protein n=1 Tax=Strongyloides papillosus TaxID=174720 RepID=A0A0N5B8W3_STREA
MFLRIFTTLLIISIFFNPDSFFVNADVFVKGTPRFQGGIGGIGGYVEMKCTDDTPTGATHGIINGREYKVSTLRGGKDIPENCNVVFHIKIEKSLKEICKDQEFRKNWYYSCPFSFNVTHALAYK